MNRPGLTHRPRIVGVDYGKKRVGIALADPLRMFARPLGTFSPEAALEALQRLHAEEGLDVIVVGWPLTLEGEAGEATRFVQAFINRLQKVFPQVGIVKQDERLTSEVAKEAIRASGARRKARRDRARVDAAAAAVILQDYLDGLEPKVDTSV